MTGFLGLGLGAIVLLCGAVWLVRRVIDARREPLCTRCRRWYENTCSIPERPHIKHCRLYTPDGPAITLEEREQEDNVIHWDWDESSR